MSQKYLHIAIPERLHKLLKLKAARAGVTVTDLVKAILGEALRKK